MKPTGRRFLVGSSITQETPTKSPQTPEIPTHQLVPLHGQKVVARENLGIPTNKEKASSRALNKALRHTAARIRHKLTARDVAKLLESDDLARKFPAWQVRDYSLLAAGNIPRRDLAKKLGTGESGLATWLAGFEREVIQGAFYLRLLKPESGKQPVPGDDFNRARNEDEGHIERDIKRPGGDHDTEGRMGIVGAGYDQTAKGLKTRPLDTFDLPEDVLDFHKGDLDDASADDTPSHDDYGENSKA